ncbi:MAG TPA: alpha-amylase family glycosyl hydrolase [Vicinamibacteria bacterium]|nr:alpha-amylase family glycosyl hydrolase [Vicinamibacteria bacterium]
MRTTTRLPALALVLLGLPLATKAQDFKREVIYQIVTDRFFNGSAANDDPPQSPGLFDASRTNWRLYWGGDLEGIRQKIAYLKGMGVTAIWISPPVDNLNVNIPDGGGGAQAPYHGYHPRDFKRIEEHFGDTSNSWAPYENLIATAHANGIKVIVDWVPNHTSSGDAGEFGALYDDGTYLADYGFDPSGYFHHNTNISDWNDRYQVQYYSLFGLADLNPESAPVDAYLKSAAQLFAAHGTDGFRIDAPKHATWGWQQSMVNNMFGSAPSFVFGEWFQHGTSDTLYRDSVKFANKSGMSLLDFPLNTQIRSVFGSSGSFRDLDATMAQENADFTWKEDQVAFVDNHDMARFLTLNNNSTRLHQALAFILTSRGIPCIYYGTEQYLHDDTGGGGDPYNRPMMASWSTSTTGYTLIKKLSDLRRSNNAIPYGSWRQRWLNDDVYIYERQFYSDVVLVAINKSQTASYNITGLLTALPAGTYADYLTGLLGGLSITVTSGSGGNNPVTAFNLGPGRVSVWRRAVTSSTPQVGSIGPTVGQAGTRVTIAGEGFGVSTGSVWFGSAAATVNSWSTTSVTFTVPSVANGSHNVVLKNSSGTSANSIGFTVLTARLIPVTFTVYNAIGTSMGDHIFLTGNTVELGQWSTTWNGAVGPMLTPEYPDWFINASMPAGQTIQFKFIKIASDGSVTWENGANHTYTVPASGVGYVNVSWQY